VTGDIGQFALVLALMMALVQGVVPLIGAQRGIQSWVATAHTAVLGQFFFLTVAYGCMTYAFLTHDFSIAYVAGHSNSQLPLMYRIAGVWGGHEGSLLLWGLMLAVWSLAVSRFSSGLPAVMAGRTVAVMGLVSVGILSFTLFTSNPFDPIFPVPADGRDLNPLLQDPGLVLHPPALYMGYVGLAVPFAIAISALLAGQLDAAWARWSRPWTTAAWAWLGLGIALGSWWAYYTLGWGGWWFWDPVENASFMPWLAATALLHSLAVSEKRGAFRTWTVLLAIIAFSLSLLGTFLVRSGVLVSVHAFATDPQRGMYILLLLAVVVGASLALYAWRAPTVKGGAAYEPVSREGGMMANNVLLVVALAAVLIGTLYPLLLDALGGGKISVGPPYFNAVFVPIILPLIFLMGLGPLLRWKKDDPMELTRRLWHTLLAALVIAVLFPLVLKGSTTLYATIGLTVAFWVILVAGRDLYGKLAHRERPLAGLRKLPASYYGMQIAHVGLAVAVIGIVVVSVFESERDISIAPGQSHEMAGYTFYLESIRPVRGPNYDAQEALVRVSRDGKHVVDLRPQKRTYWVQTMPMTNAAIQTTLRRDIFVALGDPIGRGAWSMRIYHNPMQVWLWIGFSMMVLGGFIATVDRRYRMVLARDGQSATEAARSAAGKAAEKPA
jgi:cytochrome c-type biogenesis protein CcmF